MSLYKIRSPEALKNLEVESQILDERGYATYETVHVRKDGTFMPLEISARNRGCRTAGFMDRVSHANKTLHNHSSYCLVGVRAPGGGASAGGVLGQHGAAAGAIVGILTAPSSGKDTRKKIAKKSGELKADLEEKYHKISKKISELEADTVEDFKEKFYDVKGTIKDKYAHVSSKVKDLEKELATKMEELKKQAKEVDSKAKTV